MLVYETNFNAPSEANSNGGYPKAMDQVPRANISSGYTRGWIRYFGRQNIV
jgi:hypothetical protein